MTRRVGIMAPPKHGFAAGFVQAGGAAAYGEAEVEGELAGGDVRIGAVPNDTAGFILIEAEIEEGTDEISRLGASTRDVPI